ncbi:hypothetical protein MXB_5168 [Myxobolus squamalis]|nr:hypothetical protein MXB_5168 [Myxobolus squamalis]
MLYSLFSRPTYKAFVLSVK